VSTNSGITMDWFREKLQDTPHISWENPWFSIDFPLSQSIEWGNGEMDDN